MSCGVTSWGWRVGGGVSDSHQCELVYQSVSALIGHRVVTSPSQTQDFEGIWRRRKRRREEKEEHDEEQEGNK